MESERIDSGEENVSPPCYITYLFPLSDPLPVAHGSTWSHLLEEDEPYLRDYEVVPLAGLRVVDAEGNSKTGRNMVSLRFWQVIKDDVPTAAEWQVEASRRVMQSLNPEAGHPPEDASRDRWFGESRDLTTVVEAVIFVGESHHLTASDERADPLTRCIDVLLAYHRAYRLSGPELVPSLTYQRLPALVLEARRPFPGDHDKPIPYRLIFLDHQNFQLSPTDFFDDERNGHLIDWHSRLREEDPFTVYAERRLEADVERELNGRMGESIIQVGTASEILLDGLLSLLLWEEHDVQGLSDVEAGQILSGNLKSRLRKAYAQRLKGQWSLQSEPMRGWHNRIWVPRSRAVHGGVLASRSAAEDAMSALHALEAYIGTRLRARWRSYPRTAWLFLGEPGFAKRGDYRQAQAWLDSQPGGTTAWLRQFREWRSRVEAYVDRS